MHRIHVGVFDRIHCRGHISAHHRQSVSLRGVYVRTPFALSQVPYNARFMPMTILASAATTCGHSRVQAHQRASHPRSISISVSKSTSMPPPPITSTTTTLARSVGSSSWPTSVLHTRPADGVNVLRSGRPRDAVFGWSRLYYSVLVPIVGQMNIRSSSSSSSSSSTPTEAVRCTHPLQEVQSHATDYLRMWLNTLPQPKMVLIRSQKGPRHVNVPVREVRPAADSDRHRMAMQPLRRGNQRGCDIARGAKSSTSCHGVEARSGVANTPRRGVSRAWGHREAQL